MFLRTRRAWLRACLAAVTTTCTLLLFASPAHAIAGTLWINSGPHEGLNYGCHDLRPVGSATFTNDLYLAAVDVYSGSDCAAGTRYDNVVWRGDADTFPHVESFGLVRTP